MWGFLSPCARVAKLAYALASNSSGEPLKEGLLISDGIEYRTLTYHNVLYEKYEISNTGILRNSRSKKKYKTVVSKTGYESVCVSLGSRNSKRLFKIHRCVAETFLPRNDIKTYINHIDGNKLNNNVANLEWCTLKENAMHAIKLGLLKPRIGENCSSSRFTNKQAEWIREHYVPYDKIYGTRALSRMFGVDHVQIIRIIHNRTYRTENIS